MSEVGHNNDSGVELDSEGFMSLSNFKDVENYNGECEFDLSDSR